MSGQFEALMTPNALQLYTALNDPCDVSQVLKLHQSVSGSILEDTLKGNFRSDTLLRLRKGFTTLEERYQYRHQIRRWHGYPEANR